MIKNILLVIIFLISTLTSTYAFDIRDTNNAKIVSKAAYQVNNTNLENIEANEDEGSFETSGGSEVGIQKSKTEGIYNLERGGKKKWFQIPIEFGGGKKNVLNETKSNCCCKKHLTRVYQLENNICVYYCSTRNTYVWRG